MNIAPVVLEGPSVRLEPLSLAHLTPLSEVALDPELWRYSLAPIQTREDLKDYIEDALHDQAEGKALPFAIIDRSSGRAVGSTRFGNIDADHKRVEIGWTWVGRPWQRTAVNTGTKYLMLCYAFEKLGCRRVELKTNALNQRSRTAMLRIGAREEGTFRKHMINANGTARDSVFFSIVDDDWPEVKARLEMMMERAARA